MTILKDLFQVFYPKICANCEQQLLQNETIICTFCRHDLPLTNFNCYSDNKIIKSFYGKVNIEYGNALLYYKKQGITKKLIHELKYKGNQQIGVLMGNWLGEIIKNNPSFAKVDFIIPVPLHPKKEKIRGYNQVSAFGKTISKHLNKPFLEGILDRTSTSKTQTIKSRFERFNNNDTKFTTKNTNLIRNKHLLLVDDVITTGATLEACSKALQKTTGVKISILTMAYTA